MILAVNAAQTSYSLADGLQVLAKIRRGQTQQFPRAMEHAIETFPEAKEFQPTKELIISRWTKHLTADLPTLMLSPRDLKSSRKAYLNLVELKSLDPSNSELKKLEEASANFGSNLLERASELENVPDYSRIATAFLMKLCAKQLLREGIVKTEELKDAVTIFKSQESFPDSVLSRRPGGSTFSVQADGRSQDQERSGGPRPPRPQGTVSG